MALTDTRIAEPTAAAVTVPDDPAAPPRPRRIRSIDVARGVLVLGSVFLTQIAGSGYSFARHAAWDGLPLIDFIFPAFVTLFGVSVALVVDSSRFRWRRIFRRGALLVVLGLGFNAIVSWTFDWSALRWTGVLQMYGITVLVATGVARLARGRWWIPAGLAVVLLGAYGAMLSSVAADCPGGELRPDCNLSHEVDLAAFPDDHLYRHGSVGYDPEGLGTLPGFVASGLVGVAAGMLVNRRRKAGRRFATPLVATAGVLLAVTPLLAVLAPTMKRTWPPSFVTLTAAGALALLALLHLALDHDRPLPVVAGAATWLVEGFGRNALIIYFGRSIVASVLFHVTVAGEALSSHLYDAVTWSPRPELTYSLVLVLAWSVVAAVLHQRRVYVRV